MYIKDFKGFLNESLDSDTKTYYAVVDIVADIKDGKLVSNLDETEPGFIENLTKDIKYEILQAEGPGGGWPEVEFIGTKRQLLPILSAVAADSTVDIEKELEKWDGSQEGLIDIIG